MLQEIAQARHLSGGEALAGDGGLGGSEYFVGVNTNTIDFCAKAKTATTKPTCDSILI